MELWFASAGRWKAMKTNPSRLSLFPGKIEEKKKGQQKKGKKGENQIEKTSKNNV